MTLTSRTPTRSDPEVRAAVTAELEWAPDMVAAHIGVTADHGVVVLTGDVDKYCERTAASEAALRVRGVTAVVNEIRVRPKSTYTLGETDIAREVEHALRSTASIPDTVKAEIVGHQVNLTGVVEWDYQRRAAARAVQHLLGVTSVNNGISLTPRQPAPDTEERIRQAIARNALLDPETVQVRVAEDRVTLTGTVPSWAARRQADLAAWSSPHVSEVFNYIVVKESAAHGNSLGSTAMGTK